MEFQFITWSKSVNLVTMKSLLMLLFVFANFGSITFSQNINQKDANGKRVGQWIIYKKGTKIKFEEGSFVNGRREGLWKRYYPNGTSVFISSNYKNNRPAGSYTKYYLNGRIKENGSLNLNQYRDSLVRYYENGNIEYKGSFNQAGKEQGKVTYYFENGQIEFEYETNNGVPSGRAVRYYENGSVKEETTYSTTGEVLSVKKGNNTTPLDKTVKKGQQAPLLGTPITRGKPFLPNGYNKCYTVTDEIWQDGLFKNGQLWDGKVYEYDKDRILIKVKVYKDGVYHSDGQL